MGSFLRLRRSAWDGATDEQREVWTELAEELRLGSFCWGHIGAVAWGINEATFRRSHMAYLGCLAANQAAIFAGWDPPKDAHGRIIPDQMRTELKAILEDPGLTNPLVKPADMVIPDDTENVWQFILDQQNTPAFLTMDTGWPTGFVPEGSV
jgi:hypothetical protein